MLSSESVMQIASVYLLICRESLIKIEYKKGYFKMHLDVLVSTMFDDISLYEKMNIKGSAVIINQTDHEDKEIISLKENEELTFISSKERGLSKSRNLAIKNSTADVCLLADNDVTFDNHYIETVLNGYKRYPDADVIAFTVHGDSSERSVNRLKNGRVNRVMSMKISSVQISFKRDIVEKHNLYLKEDFGAGSEKFNSGEESIFLYTAIKKGLKVYYIDEKIGEVSFEDSTWYGKNPEKDLLTKGAMFYCMSPYLYPFYNLQFAIRKHNEYKHSFTLAKMIALMFQGSKEGKDIC